MEALVALFTLAITFGMLALILLICLVPVGAMFALPFRYKQMWADWTASGKTDEAYENVAQGSTTGPIQIFPASYLYEASIRVEATPEQARKGVATFYGDAPFVAILFEDETGVAVDLRIPNGLGPGWIGVFKVEPHEQGAVVHARLRSTFCLVFPVLTFFLALQHHLHLERLVKESAAKAAKAEEAADQAD